MVNVSLLALALATIAIAAPDYTYSGGNGGGHGGVDYNDHYTWSSEVDTTTTTTTTTDDASTTTTTTTTTTSSATSMMTTTTTNDPVTTTTTTTSTSSAPTLSATPHSAQFDNIAITPGAPLQPVGLYDNVFFQDFNLANEGNFANNIDGVTPQSAPNVIAYNLQAAPGATRRVVRRQSSTPALIVGQMGSTARFLGLSSFYLGCTASTTNNTAAVAVACTIQATGYLSGIQVAQQSFFFSPSGTPAPMVASAADSSFANLTSVTFATQGSNSSAVAVLLDNLVFATYQ